MNMIRWWPYSYMPSYLFRNNYELQVCISMNKEIMESSFMYFFFHEALHWYK